jgi:hypothetical protein
MLRHGQHPIGESHHRGLAGVLCKRRGSRAWSAAMQRGITNNKNNKERGAGAGGSLTSANLSVGAVALVRASVAANAKQLFIDEGGGQKERSKNFSIMAIVNTLFR